MHETICTPDIELLSVSFRSFYLSREFPQLFFTVVCIHPRANAMSIVIWQRFENKWPIHDLPNNQEAYIKLDLCYGTIHVAYKTKPMPSFGASSHQSVFLAPVYRPVCECMEPVVKLVKRWIYESIECLWGCFDCMVWGVFYDSCDK